MRFRPCIDIHNGKVKQIVGGSLKDAGDEAKENYQSNLEASYYAEKYKNDQLKGGHVIMLNAATSDYYEETKQQALLALQTYPGGLQIGGGIHAENAKEFIEAGASHVIVTSYAFKGGEILWEHLSKLKEAVGKEHVVLDLSCRKRDGKFYVVTDRWQTFTEIEVSKTLFEQLESFCDEFLVHGVDVEGCSAGVDEQLANILVEYQGNPLTYAGGIGSIEDLSRFKSLTSGKIDFTIGSALDLFGGKIPYEFLAQNYDSCE